MGQGKKASSVDIPVGARGVIKCSCFQKGSPDIFEEGESGFFGF
jgi:hypothetical protein